MSGSAIGSQYQTFGLGGASTGRASGVTADPTTPYAAIYNPALLAAQTKPIFGFSTAAQKASYASLGTVRIEREKTRGRSAPPQPVKPPDLSLMTWAAGLSYPFSLGNIWNRRAGLGVTFSGPFNRFRSFAGGTPDDFCVLRYGTADSQFKMAAGAGIELVPETLFFGAGVSVFLSGGGSADATLVSDNPTSSMALEVGLNTSAILGVYGTLGNDAMSLVYHQEVNPSFRQRITGRVELGDTEVVQQPFFIATTLYYEPQSFEMEWQHNYGWLTASIGASYQIWNHFQPSSLVTQTVDAAGVTRTTTPAEIALRNTISPRASVQLPLFEKVLTVSSGYQFRPSPISDLSGATNILDADTHVVGLSLQHRLSPGSVLPWEITWGVYAQYHWLKSRPVTKASAASAGAPGYIFSGNAQTYGISLHASL